MFQCRRLQVLPGRKRRIFIALLCISLVFCGCAPLERRPGWCKGLLGRATRICDRIPDDVPKGYVEFYITEESDLTGNGADVYQLHGGKEEQQGNLYGWNMRCAAEPGLHIFGVKYGTANKRVSVKVVSGMITPVGVSIFETREAERNYATTYYFNMYLDVQDPVPLGSPKPKENRIPHIRLPQAFAAHYNSVWSGELTVSTESIGFSGRDSQCYIRFDQIERVAFGYRALPLTHYYAIITYHKEGQSLDARFVLPTEVNFKCLKRAIRYAMERKGMRHLIVDSSK